MNPVRSRSDEVGELGEEIYRTRIRAEVETPENIGKMVIIDVDTGEYEVDKIGLTAAHSLRARHSDARLYGIRIGYKTAEAIGGVLERTVP